MTTTAYVSIGNSDDKLSQADWSIYVANVRAHLRRMASAVHGEWYSAPDAPYQNACFCVEFPSQDRAEVVKLSLAESRKAYRQDSIAWAVAATEFV